MTNAKIRYRGSFGEMSHTLSVAEFVEKFVYDTGPWSDRGAMESIGDKTDAVLRALAALCQILADKKLLTDHDIQEITQEHNVTELIHEE